MSKYAFWKAIYHLTVPQHWIIPTCSVLLGTATAYDFLGEFHLIRFLLNAFCGLMCLCSVNVLNNYRDYKLGNDTIENCQLHPEDNPIVSSGLSAKFALGVAVVCLIFAALAGGVIIFLTSPKVIWFAIIALAAILGYTTGPYSFSSLPLGELLSGVVEGGILAMASYYIQTLSFRPAHFLLYLPAVFAIAIIMFANNTSDMEKDLAVGRHTLPSVLGRKLCKPVFFSLILFGTLSVILLSVIFFCSYAVPIISIVLILRCSFLVKDMFHIEMDSAHRNISMPVAIKAHKWLTLSYLAVILVHSITVFF